MFDTILPADSVEFCPHPDAQDIFVCGTYNLFKSDEVVRTQPQKRNGQCLVFRCQYDQDDIAKSSLWVMFYSFLSFSLLKPPLKWQHPKNWFLGTSRYEMVRSFFRSAFRKLFKSRISKWRCHRSASSKATLALAGSEGEIYLLDWNFEEVGWERDIMLFFRIKRSPSRDFRKWARSTSRPHQKSCVFP